jgi:hypothetical protein
MGNFLPVRLSQHNAGTTFIDYMCSINIIPRVLSRNWFNSTEIKEVIENNRKGLDDGGGFTWKLLVLKKWLTPFHVKSCL